MKALSVATLAFIGSSLVTASSVAQPQSQPPTGMPWRGCCGATPWPSAGGMMGGGVGRGMMGGGMGGSMGRHHAGMMGGVPAPYTNLNNPLPQTEATIQRGAAIYAAQCASCHGVTGLGDGPGARTLNPRPANLAWLSDMPMSRWDPFMYWAIAEGGKRYGTAMPAFKDTLSKDDIWAVTAYIQAHLPQVKATR